MILQALETRSIELASEIRSVQNEPFILDNLETLKPALDKWGFEFFEKNFGDELVILCDDAGNAKRHIKSTLRNYINYVLCQPNDLPQLDSERKWYLANWKILADSIALRNDFTPPPNLVDFLPELSPSNRQWHYGKLGWLYLGPAGTTTFPHRDILGTHAWLSQIIGGKIVRILDKSIEQRHISSGCKGMFPWVWEAKLHPGQTLFIPSNCVHEAISETPSISLSFNFINHDNQATVEKNIHENPDLWQRIIKETDVTWPN